MREDAGEQRLTSGVQTEEYFEIKISGFGRMWLLNSGEWIVVSG